MRSSAASAKKRLGTDREHLGVHQVTHRVRERHEPRGGVGVVRSDDERCAARPSELDHVIAGPMPAGGDETRRPGLKSHRLRTEPVADDDRVARLDARGQRRRLCRADEHVAGHARVRVAGGELAVERAHQLPHRHRHALEALDLGLVEVARGKCPLADKPDRAPVGVDDR